ncbi:dihydroneopterin aldolase [Melittangium boletus]|uniref:dihydroneopterin aldolase n=1 Tax=Melittangium boletus DSM 14713 TaxID=1294270 RepID=A0A250I9J3_9BACT|nr:dihydroneopterin aldolase [Melittangium boletus]ATB28544.1 dihydroneopterin aldolase [Melittangium boletus DSM 14713]
MSAETFELPRVLDARGRPLDVITIRGLTVDCIVGIYNRERVAAQPLRLDVALFLDTRPAAASGRLADTVHYGRLSGELRFILEACRFELLESAAEAVCQYLLAPPAGGSPRARVLEVSVRLTKPLALGGAAVPGLQVHRTAEELGYGEREAPFGHVDVLHEGVGYGLYRLRVKPGGVIPAHAHPVMEESELVLGTGLLLQGHAVGSGTAFHWPRGFPHRYDNPTDREQMVLCVARPRLMTSDERVTEPPAEGLATVRGHAYYPAEEQVPLSDETLRPG